MILYKIHHKQRRAKVRVGQRALMVGVIVCAMVLPGAWRVIRTPIFTDVDSDDGLTNRLLDAVVSQIDHSHDFVLTSHRDERALFLGVSAATSHRVGKRGLVSATIGISRGFSDHAPTRVMKVTCWDEELRNCALAALKFASSMTKEGRVISAPVIEALLRTNAEIESALRNETPSRVVSRMWSSGHWDAFTGRISSGDRAAIALVPEVAKGTDAGASEDLGISLAEALVKAPDAVLPVLELAPNRTLSVGFVCSAPFIEDSNAHQRAYKAKALKAVTLARLNPSLVRQGQTCIEKLKQIELHD